MLVYREGSAREERPEETSLILCDALASRVAGARKTDTVGARNEAPGVWRETDEGGEAGRVSCLAVAGETWHGQWTVRVDRRQTLSLGCWVTRGTVNDPGRRH
jgi:hypothetical protein